MWVNGDLVVPADKDNFLEKKCPGQTCSEVLDGRDWVSIQD